MQNYQMDDTEVQETDNTQGYNRFDLEAKILECWRVVDDMDTMVEKDDPASALEAIAGMRVLYQAKFEKLWDIFEDMVASRKM